MYATILSCLVEFNSIEQALAFQDDSERMNPSPINNAPKVIEKSPIKMPRS